MINRFKNITEEMVELYEKKNSDYGDSVHDTYIKYGPVSFLVRMEDKINRVKTLTETEFAEPVIKEEKVRDTLIDLANYAILMILEMEREKELECNIYVDNLQVVHKDESIIGYHADGSPITMRDDEIWSFETKRNKE